MQLKSALIAALLGVSSVVQASTIPSRGLAAREPAGPGNFGNNFKGGKTGNTGTNNANTGSNTNNAAAASSSAATGTNNNNNNKGGAAAAATLNANAVQTGSAQNGQAGNAVEAGQVASLTDNANFINFCSGKTLTNGLQVTGGSCNGVVMGQMPAKTAMVSSILTFPGPGQNIAANQQFNVSLKIKNIQTGFFTNAQTTYYSAPQQLNQQGLVIGHTHVTIQDLGNSLTPAAPLDASQFVFFKGINNAADANGDLSATVTGGLPAGNYRVCTMAGAANHQPVLMPVAQRGAQDDCNKFTVGGNGGNANGGNANTGKGNAGTGTANNAAAASSAAASGTANANTGKTGKTGGAANAGTGKNGKSGSNSSNNNSGTSNANQSNGNQNASAATAATSTTATAAASAAASTTASTAASGSSASNAIGGITAPAVTNSGDSTRPFSVNGNTFVNKAAAVQRACSIQNNACADAVNSGSVKGSTVADCNKQETTCNSQAA